MKIQWVCNSLTDDVPKSSDSRQIMDDQRIIFGLLSNKHSEASLVTDLESKQ